MEATLHALGGILLKALPTFFLVIVLHFYLRRVFFGPLEKILQARSAATEGARRLADETLAKASARAAEYEAALQAARSETYREQEQFRRRMQEERAAGIKAARDEAENRVRQAKTQLEAEAAELKKTLGATSEQLADEIAAAVLRRSAA